MTDIDFATNNFTPKGISLIGQPSYYVNAFCLNSYECEIEDDRKEVNRFGLPEQIDC